MVVGTGQHGCRSSSNFPSTGEFDDLLFIDGLVAQTFHILIMHLATLDPHFFELVKRITAQTLWAYEKPDRFYSLLAAQLLTDEPPKEPTKIARDVPLIIGLAVGQLAGLKPTGNSADGGPAKMLRMLADDHDLDFTYDNLVYVWKAREKKLVRGGFGQLEVLEFLSSISPMQK